MNLARWKSTPPVVSDTTRAPHRPRQICEIGFATTTSAIASTADTTTVMKQNSAAVLRTTWSTKTLAVVASTHLDEHVQLDHLEEIHYRPATTRGTGTTTT